MSMLAEPRQKTRYTLTPKGKPLFEDNDRFGTKMLEKMGWSKGKGLGREEDGNQEFVRVKYKRDGNGLGFESRDDQWTEHEKHFSGLLENLNGDSDSKTNSVPDDSEDIPPTAGLGFASSDTSNKKKLKDKLSGQSLEEKSKNSKARVHYKKFTKGKDIAQYSEKDLANIFGKKATPEDTNIYNQFQAFNANGNESDEKEEGTVQVAPEQSGTSIINTGVSVNDYFKMKIAALKEKQGLTSKNPFQSSTRIVNGVEVFVPSQSRNSAEETEVTKTEEPEEEEEVPRKKKKKSKKQCDVAVAEYEPIAEEDTPEEKATRKKKKSKKLVESTEEQSEQQGEETNLDETMEPISEGKKKIKKLHEELSESITKEDDSKESDNQQKKKAKKSKKRSREDLENEEQIEDCVPVEDEIPKKKKKDKKKSADEIDSRPEGSEECVVPIKKKKSKKSLPDQPEESTPPPVQEQNEAPEHTTQDAKVIPSIEPTKQENIKPKKSKKKNNKSSTPPTEEEVSSLQTNLNPLTDVHSYLLDTYTISTFCAEKFRNVELDSYKGSNLMDLTGYGLKEDIQLNVKKISMDAQRILRLWNGTLDKYTNSGLTSKLYKAYRKKLINARNAKTAMPRLKFKTLKRKHVFQGM